ncbi:tatD related DNase domain-containing protein [Hirsutella rhossiliensis]
MAAAQLKPGRPPYVPRYVDIGINLADPIFRGVHRGTQRHPDDLDAVVRRAREVGCSKLMVTGSDFKSARDALKLADEYPGIVYATAGIHPCSSSVFTSDAPGPEDEHTPPCESDPSAPIPAHQKPDPARSVDIIAEFTALLAEATSSSHKHLVAVGEFGLDYDRLHYCNKAVQLHSFACQLDVAASLSPQLPLFLHCRAAHADFVSLLKASFGDGLERLERGAVVHSFTGTAEEMAELMDLGLYIGINGCSLKTEENCAVVKAVRLDRIMLETDGPWCEELAESNASSSLTREQQEPQKQPKKGQKKEPQVPERYKVVKKEKWEEGAMVKGRNEPCTIERVAKIVAAVKGVSVEELCEAAWGNSIKVFGLGEKG